LSEPERGEAGKTLPGKQDVTRPRERRRFPKAARLTRATEFRRVKDHGRSWGGRFLVLGVLREAAPSQSGDCRARIGFITSRRVGGAVERNRVRRRLREIVRAQRPRLCADCWIVIIARHTAAAAASAELAEDWLRLAQRASILRPPGP
jgi:ribonuclease P protein component